MNVDARKAEIIARTKWNQKADEFNQWSELGGDEREELINAVLREEGVHLRHCNQG
jgi:hypothetical protein